MSNNNTFGKPVSDVSHTNATVSGTIGNCSTRVRASCVVAGDVNTDLVNADIVNTNVLIVNGEPFTPTTSSFEEGVLTLNSPLWTFYGDSAGQIYRFGNLIIMPLQVQVTSAGEVGPMAPAPAGSEIIGTVPAGFRPSANIRDVGGSFFDPVPGGTVSVGAVQISIQPGGNIVLDDNLNPGGLGGVGAISLTISWRAP